MNAKVGTEDSIRELVTNLIYLEHDAVAAHDSCIEQVGDNTVGMRIAEFWDDHLLMRRMVHETGADACNESDIEGTLTGKIVLADIIGDAPILKAMTTNENDTVTRI